MEKLEIKIKKVQELLEWRVKNSGNGPEPREKTKQENLNQKWVWNHNYIWEEVKEWKKKKGKKWDQSYNNDYKNTKQVND